MCVQMPTAGSVKKLLACACVLIGFLALQGCAMGNDLSLHQQNNKNDLSAKQALMDQKVLDGMAYNHYYIDWAISRSLTVDSLNGRAFFSEAGNNPRYENNLLVIAKEYDNLSMAAHLLALGADPNKLALQDGRPAFSHWKEHIPILRQAVRFGANLAMSYGDSDMTLLTEAITDVDLPLTRFLMEHGVPVRQADVSLAQQVAAEKQSHTAEIIVALLSDSVGEAEWSSDKTPPVILCALGRQAQLFEPAILAQADIKELLQTAVWFGHIEIVEQLLNDYTFDLAFQRELLLSAIEQGNEKIISLVFQKNPSLLTADFGVQALSFAIETDQATAVQILLEQEWEGDLIETDKARSTVSLLDTACEYGNPDIVEMVSHAYMKHGAISQELLCRAATGILSKHNYYDAKGDNMQCLLSLGADPNYVLFDSGEGVETLFYTAITSQSAELTSLMIAHGADINQPLYDTPPICIAASSTLSVLELFGAADMNARDTDGMTPLMHAARATDGDCVTWLVQHGADVSLVSDNGKCAADYALGIGADIVLEKLKI